MLRQFVEARHKYKRPFRKPLEVYRCDADGKLLTDRMVSRGTCAGHHMKQPTIPTLLEFILIWIGLIR